MLSQICTEWNPTCIITRVQNDERTRQQRNEKEREKKEQQNNTELMWKEITRVLHVPNTIEFGAHQR